MTKELLQQLLAFVERVTHWEEGGPDRHDTLVALRAAIAQPAEVDAKDAERPMELPRLPHSFAYIFEWSDGTQKLSSNSRNGVGYTSSYAVYTADQVRKIQREAIRAAIAQPVPQATIWTNLDFAMQDPIFNQCRAIMGTANEFQDGALLNVLRYFATIAQPVPPATPKSKLLTEHSGCGHGTQVDQLTVRLNPGDKVVLVMGRYSAAAIAQPEQPVSEDEFTAGVNAAAAMLDKMADDYADEHSTQDHDTGVWEFGRYGEDYYKTLRELADEVRDLVLGNTRAAIASQKAAQ